MTIAVKFDDRSFAFFRLFDDLTDDVGFRRSRPVARIEAGADEGVTKLARDLDDVRLGAGFGHGVVGVWRP